MQNKLFEQARFKLLLERFQNARFWVALRAPVWDRSLSTRHGEPRFGVDCMKLRHTPLYRRNVFIDFYFGQLLSPNGCVPALGKFGNDEKSCKSDEKSPENHRKPVRAPQSVLKYCTPTNFAIGDAMRTVLWRGRAIHGGRFEVDSRG